MEKGFFEKIRGEIETSRFSTIGSEEGKVLSVGDGIVHISGLSDAKLYELIEFENGDEGIVFDLDAHSIGVVLLTEKNGTRAGEKAYKTERIATVNVRDSLLGRVVNALGMPIDEGSQPENTVSYTMEREAPSLLQRVLITTPPTH